MPLPPNPPRISLAIVGERPASERWYLRVRRHSMTATYEDGTTSEPFPYDAVERWNADAVAVLPYFDRGGRRTILLRSSLRPPIAVRGEAMVEGSIPLPPGARDGVLWEICAGLVEKDERSAEGLLRCAAREMDEELGIAIPIDRLMPLGAPIFPSAGVIGECVHLFACEVQGERGKPIGAGDGSPLERGARLLEASLDDALGWCDAGALPDVKTEIAIRRLARRLG